MVRSPLYAKIAAVAGSLCYVAWGVFHVGVANDIRHIGLTQSGIAQGRTFQLAAYMLCIALFAIVTALVGNWRNQRLAYWLNLCVIGWADAVWVAVVVAPGYVPLVRGLTPPFIYLLGAVLTSLARSSWLKAPAGR